MPTVFSIIRRPDLTPWASGLVTFRPSSAPWFRAPDVVADADIQAWTDPTGYFSQQLASGYYWVWIGNNRPFVIIVPETEETYLLHDVRKEGTGTATGLLTIGTNYRLQEGVLQLVNGSTGLWHPIWLADVDGEHRLAIGEPDAEVEVNYQVSGDTLLLKNFSTGAYHPVYVRGSSPAYRIEVGEAADEVDDYRVLSAVLQLANLDTEKFHTIFVMGASGAYSLAIGPETT